MSLNPGLILQSTDFTSIQDQDLTKAFLGLDSNDNHIKIKKDDGSIVDLENTSSDLDSPIFTGVPSGPTAVPGTNTTQLATTAFVIANAGGFTITDITYTALKNLRDTSTLAPGYYRITDFATIYDQPDYDSGGLFKGVLVTKTGITEPLIVFALSTSELHARAYSELFPRDIINYYIDFTSTEVTSSPAKGRIVYREDSNYNKASYDFRAALFIRYESFPTSGIFNVINDNGGTMIETDTFNGVITDCMYNNLMVTNGFELFPNIIFGNFSNNNIIGIGSYNMTMSGYNYSNEFGTACGNILFTGDASNNKIGSNTTEFILGNNNNYNEFGTYTTGIIGDNNINNVFGDNNNITFGNSNSSNRFGNYNTITFGDSNIQNTFGHNNVAVFIDTNERNTIGHLNPNISFGTGNKQNTLGNRSGITGGVILGNNNLYNEMHDFGNTRIMGNNNSGNICESVSQFTIGNLNGDNHIKEQCSITMGNSNTRNRFGSHDLFTCIDANSDNEFGNFLQNCTFGNSNVGNHIGGFLLSLSLGDGNSNNRIGSGDLSLTNIALGNNNSSNVVGDSPILTTILIGDDNIDNKIGENNFNTIIGNTCINNKIGNNCTMQIPNSSVRNEILDNNIATTFNAPLINNKFGNSTLVSQNFAGATHVYTSYYTESQLRQDLTVRLKYTDNADAIVVANINS